MTILKVHNLNFGDLWASVNIAGRRGEFLGRQDLSSMVCGTDRRKILQEIIDTLDMPVPPVLTNANPDTEMAPWSMWYTEYYKTNPAWDYNSKHSTVVCQLDESVSLSEYKNCPTNDITLIHGVIRNLGFTPIKLGKHLSVKQCVEEASKAAFFVGVDSGMSHLCHSVGLPVFMMEYRYPVWHCHSNKAHYLCRGFSEFLTQVRRHMTALHICGHPDGKLFRDDEL